MGPELIKWFATYIIIGTPENIKYAESEKVVLEISGQKMNHYFLVGIKRVLSFFYLLL